jgi:GNAT superfamily N-acetyltransferase
VNAIIRAANTDDLSGVLDLYRHLHPDDPVVDVTAAEPVWSALTSSALTTVLVADADGVLVASCTLVIVPNLTHGARPYGVIENVVTHAKHRRAGFGRAVLHEALDRAWKARCYKVMLATGSQQDATLRFYEDAGFARGLKTCFEVRR